MVLSCSSSWAVSVGAQLRVSDAGRQLALGLLSLRAECVRVGVLILEDVPAL